jgi:hypothetical protein
VIVTNYRYNTNVCGHYFAGETRPNWVFQPHTMRGFYTRPQTDENISQIERDSIPTGTNPPYSIVLGAKGALLSSTTYVTGEGEFSITSLSMGLAAAADLDGQGDITNASLSLIIQLACSILASGDISAALVGKLEMAADLAASGDLAASLSLIAFVVSDITGSGTISATLRGDVGLSADITSSSTLSPESLAAAVWNSIAASFNTAGTMGNKLNSAASAGDPWSTELPGSYASGEAGAILAQIQTLVDELHKIQGLDSDNPMTVTPTTRIAGSINLELTGDGETETIVTRQ